MTLGFVVVCQQAILVPQGTHAPSGLLAGSNQILIVGPTLLLRPRQLPTEFSFSVVIGVRGAAISGQPSPQLTARFVTPEGEPVAAMGPVNLQAPPPPPGVPSLPPDEANAIIVFQLQNVYLATEGPYAIVVNIDGQDLGQTMIPVRPLPKEVT
jgi:hypothetical protein